MIKLFYSKIFQTLLYHVLGKLSFTDLIEVLSKKISHKCDIFLSHLEGKKPVRKAKGKKHISVSTEHTIYRLHKHSSLSLCSQGKCSSLQPTETCSAELIPDHSCLVQDGPKLERQPSAK